MERENILHKVRTALGRSVGQAPGEPPAARIRIPETGIEARIESMLGRVAALAGKTHRASSPSEARAYVETALNGRSAVTSNSAYLEECGITSLPNVRRGGSDRKTLRELCATLDAGITSADYALADTGTLVMIAGPQEARLVSLLPPCHIAIVPQERILSGLDELFAVLPQPAEQTSSMVLITGPSRTADIEQILVRGVHGPGEIHVVVVG